jgi:hypothetical protein
VSALRPALAAVVDLLLAESEDGRTLTIDRIGEALGTEVAGSADIEAMFDLLEAAGRTIEAPEGSDLRARLHVVLGAARTIGARTGQKATLAAIASETGLGEDQVRHALSFGRVLGR